MLKNAKAQIRCALLSRRHLVLIANLRELILDEWLAQTIHDLPQAQLYATICHYLLLRERVHVFL